MCIFQIMASLLVITAVADLIERLSKYNDADTVGTYNEVQTAEVLGPGIRAIGLVIIMKT